VLVDGMLAVGAQVARVRVVEEEVVGCEDELVLLEVRDERLPAVDS
jgi:hypothetical protein